MKLYIFDTINRYKRYSGALDVNTDICNHPWIGFNDGGTREVYKFKEDGTINVIKLGRVTKGTWEYDSSDKTIIISASDQAFMFHPSIFDDMLLALQVDGSDECFFLIEENNSQNFAPKTYGELMEFFKEKEKKRAKKEMNSLQLMAETEKERLKVAKDQIKQIEKKLAQIEASEKEKNLEEEELNKRKKEYLENRLIEEFKSFLLKNNYNSYSKKLWDYIPVFVYVTLPEILVIIGGIIMITASISMAVSLVSSFIYPIQVNFFLVGSAITYCGLLFPWIIFFIWILYYIPIVAIKGNIKKNKQFNILLDKFITLPQNQFKINNELEEKLKEYK